MESSEHLSRYIRLIESIVGSITPAAMPNLPAQELLDSVATQQSNGAFLAPDLKANPETRWFNEMRILHALAGYAITAKNPAIDQAVQKAADYHLREIQPDHATADPWALLAYIQYAPPLADQILHAMQMQYPRGPHGTPLLLLSDVLYGLQLLMKDNHNE